MIKSLLRNVGINAFSLFALSQFLEGVKISGGLATFVFGGFALALLTMVIRPILGLIALPFNLLTFGAFSFLINAAILYLLTIFVTQISISPFTFAGFSLYGFIIPKIYFNGLFAFIVSAFLLSVITSFIIWLTKN